MALAECVGGAERKKDGGGRMTSRTATVNRLTKDVTMTVTVKISRQFRFRLAIALFLIRLAAKILGCKLEVVEAFDGLD